jgi:hypothetical protein
MGFKSLVAGVYKDHKVKTIAGPTQNQLSLFFKKQGKLLLSKLDKYEKDFNETTTKYPEVFHVDEFDMVWDEVEQETSADLAEIITKVEVAGLASGVGYNGKTFPFGQVFDLKNPRAQSWFSQHGGSTEYIKGIQTTTKDQIKNLVVKKIEKGESYTQLAKEIQTKFEGFSKDRAKLIAVHESAQAFEGGNRMAIDDLVDLGLEYEKQSNSMKDEKVAPLDVKNDEIGWIPLDQPFPSGHQHAPFHVRCRCWIEYRRIKTDSKSAKVVVAKDFSVERLDAFDNFDPSISVPYRYNKIGLSFDQEDAMYAYKGQDYSKINRCLRGADMSYLSDKKLDEVKRTIAGMKEGFKSEACNCKEPIQVFRGIDSDVASQVLKTGKYTDKGFTSTTLSYNKALKGFATDFDGGYKNVMSMVVPKGTKIVSFVDEHEVLLSSGQKMKLVMVEEMTESKIRMLHMVIE